MCNLVTLAEERISFSSLVGQSIFFWSNVEHSLLGLVTACLAGEQILAECHEKSEILSEFYSKMTGVEGIRTNVPPYLHPLAEAFFSIENFRSKLKFVEKAFYGAIQNPELRKEWDAVATSVQAASIKRNTFAHPLYREFRASRAGRRCVIIPSGLKPSTRKTKANTPPPGAIGLRELELTAQGFASTDWLIQRLTPLVVEERTGLKSPVSQLRPIAPQPRPLIRIVRQMLQGIEPQPQSSEA